MTAASLLSRLRNNRPKVSPVSRNEDLLIEQLQRAEFDRALLLDAAEHRYETRKRCDDHFERMIDGQESDEAQYQLDLVEANAASVALRTIVTELRSNP